MLYVLNSMVELAEYASKRHQNVQWAPLVGLQVAFPSEARTRTMIDRGATVEPGSGIHIGPIRDYIPIVIVPERTAGQRRAPCRLCRKAITVHHGK